MFMKNNYAFGGNNCCVIASVKPEQSPVTNYQPKRVAITGMGAVSSVGHTLQSMLEKMWAQEPLPQLFSPALDDDTRQGFRELLNVMLRNQGVADYMGNRFGEQDVECELNKPGGVHQVQGLDARKTLRRFDPRKANTISTFALLALTQAMNDAGRRLNGTVRQSA